MFKKFLTSLILLSFLTAPFKLLSAEITLSNYLLPFYSKHSRWLDITYQPVFKTWHFNIPYYEPEKQWQETISHPRWQMSSATFYKYRLDNSPYARKIVRQAILDSTLNSKRAIFDQSFNDAIANFLVVRLLENNLETRHGISLLTSAEKQSILKWIKKRLSYGLSAPDTENRAALAGVYWYYVGQYLYENNFLTDNEWQQVQKLTKQKINLSIEQTLRQAKTNAPTAIMYRESGLFSLHYHIVQAYMLLNYGKMTGEQKYINIAQKMTDTINQLAADDGFLDASLGHRPSGIGAQGYLMAGILNLYFDNDAQAQKFLNYADGNRFFADPKYPNRLVWFNTTNSNYQLPITNYQLNDDISFVNMAELALFLFENK